MHAIVGCEQALAGRAIKELAESEWPAFSSPHPQLESLFTGGCIFNFSVRKILRVFMMDLLHCSVERLVFTHKQKEHTQTTGCPTKNIHVR